MGRRGEHHSTNDEQAEPHETDLQQNSQQGRGGGQGDQYGYAREANEQDEVDATNRGLGSKVPLQHRSRLGTTEQKQGGGAITVHVGQIMTDVPIAPRLGDGCSGGRENGHMGDRGENSGGSSMSVVKLTHRQHGMSGETDQAEAHTQERARSSSEWSAIFEREEEI